MIIKIVRKSTLCRFLMLFICMAACGILLIWPNAASSGISRGLAICSSIIIPSLFPFIVLAGFIVKSGLCASIGRRFERPTRLIFGLPGCCAPGILISLIGGYPAGGIAVGELVRQGLITREQGRRMLSFCVNGGPAFIVSAIGAGMLGSVKYGVMLYSAHIAASVLIGILLRIGTDTHGNKKPSKKPAPVSASHMTAASAFVESVGSACYSLLIMCGFIVLFASLLSISDASGASAKFQAVMVNIFKGIWPESTLKGIAACIFPCLIEVSCGSVEAARIGSEAPLLLGIALGWGGLSVHCQVAAALKGQKLIGRGFFAMRFLHAMLGGLFSVILFRLIPVTVFAFKPLSDAIVLPGSSNAAASAALLSLCALFLLTVARRSEETAEN
ncbi:MAG: hypothetical protein PHH84_08240 [Oscillospiraceae bacterium]|nr:hypothetical protein [Oscillospiraceae bacterium]